MKTIRTILALLGLYILFAYAFPTSCEIQRTGKTLNGNPLYPGKPIEQVDTPVDAPLEYKIPETVR